MFAAQSQTQDTVKVFYKRIFGRKNKVRSGVSGECDPPELVRTTVLERFDHDLERRRCRPELVNLRNPLAVVVQDAVAFLYVSSTLRSSN